MNNLKNRRPLWFGLPVLALSLVLSGCGGSTESVSEEETGAAQDATSGDETADDLPADLVVTQVQKMNMFLDSDLDGDTAIFYSDAHDDPERVSSICQSVIDDLAEFGHTELEVELEIDALGHINCAEELG